MTPKEAARKADFLRNGTYVMTLLAEQLQAEYKPFSVTSRFSTIPSSGSIALRAAGLHIVFKQHTGKAGKFLVEVETVNLPQNGWLTMWISYGRLRSMPSLLSHIYEEAGYAQAPEEATTSESEADRGSASEVASGTTTGREEAPGVLAEVVAVDQEPDGYEPQAVDGYRPFEGLTIPNTLVSTAMRAGWSEGRVLELLVHFIEQQQLSKMSLLWLEQHSDLERADVHITR